MSEPSLTDITTPSDALALTLHNSRPGSRGEITSVSISTAASAAFAIYPGPQTTCPWVDVFDLRNQRKYSKICGSNAFFSPAGNLVAILRSDAGSGNGNGSVNSQPGGAVVISNFITGKTKLELKDAKSGPVAWNQNGRYVAASEGKDRIGVWDVSSGARIGRVVSHIDTVTHVAFTPQNTIATLSRDGTVRVTNPLTSKTLSRLETNSSNPRALHISPSGHTIVSIWGSTVHVWLPQASQLSSYNMTSTRKREGWPLCFSTDGRFLACWSEEGFDVMDIMSGKVLVDKIGGALVTAGAFSEDGGMLMLGRMDGAIEIWDVEGMTG